MNEGNGDEEDIHPMTLTTTTDETPSSIVMTKLTSCPLGLQKLSFLSSLAGVKASGGLLEQTGVSHVNIF